MDRFSVVPADQRDIVGLINVNTAPRRVLETLPTITDEQVDALLDTRDGLSDEARMTAAWLIAVLMLALLAFASPAESQSGFTTPTYGVVRGAPGTSVVVAAQKVPADLVGSECDVVLVGANNESVHPGNDLTVTSAGSSVS